MDKPMDYDPPDSPDGEGLEVVVLTESQWTDLEHAVEQFSGWAAIEGRKDVATRYQEILHEVRERD